MDEGDARDAEASYETSLEEIRIILEGDAANPEALAIKAELENGLAALHAQKIGPVQAAELSSAAVIGPSLPSALLAAEAVPAVARPSKRQRILNTTSSNNAHMHPGTGYADQEPDFAVLAADDTALAPYVRRLSNGRVTVNFKDAEACKAVTTALLRRDFGVQWALTDGQLIPPVPGRVNYIAWIADLLALSQSQGPVVGLDIGCGANLIYPLLGAAQHGWKFVAADITDAAILGAQHNLAINPHLQKHIEVRDVRQCPTESLMAQQPMSSVQPDILGSEKFPGGILRPAILPDERFTFCMCNPPFFESMDQAGLNPRTAHNGTPAEMVCPGGEAAFVGAIIADSLILRRRVHWFTSMVGRKATLKALRMELHRHRPTAIRTTEFFQGCTSRWGLAWSFAADPETAKRPLVRQPQPSQLAVSPLQS